MTTFTKTIGLEQWTLIPNNPRQRNTERHANKIEPFLQVALAVHATVAAAQLPDGSFVKLDGHSRSLLWDANRIPTPNILTVQIYPVSSMAEAKRLYDTFDNTMAVETKADKVCGAFREIGFSPVSPLLQRGTLASALKILEYARTGDSKSTARGVDASAAVAEWRSELPCLDRIILGFTTRKLPAGVIAAMMLTIRKRGFRAVEPFWASYLDPNETGSVRDPHNVLLNMLRRRRDQNAMGGLVAAHDITAKAVASCEHGLAGSQIKAIRGTDITKYLDAPDSALSAARLAYTNKGKSREEPRPTA